VGPRLDDLLLTEPPLALLFLRLGLTLSRANDRLLPLFLNLENKPLLFTVSLDFTESNERDRPLNSPGPLDLDLALDFDLDLPVGPRE